MSAHSLSIASDGRFAGYASVFGQPDQGNDIVMPGAFAKSLKAKGAADIRMLFQHDPKEPVGVWHRVVEDGFGLWVEGRLTDGVERSDGLRQLIAQGAVDGLSIGFRTIKATKDRQSGHRRLWQIDLWEISIVTFPMMEGARIASGAQRPVGETGPDRSPRQALAAAISVLQN